MKLINEQGMELYIIPCKDCIYHSTLCGEHFCDRHTHPHMVKEYGFCDKGEKEKDGVVVQTGDFIW